MKMKRSYTMGARAAAVEQTRRRIVVAMFELGSTRVLAEVSLDDVARTAGVSVQTVLRQFGSRAGLVEATIEHALDTVTEERRAPVGDVGGALEVLLEHYERRGRTALLMLAQEGVDEQVGRVARTGRRLHRAWVEDVFAPWLGGGPDGLADLLVVATDVYTWKLLRLDRGLSRAVTRQRMAALVEALLTAGPQGTAGPRTTQKEARR
jgi:AcrR family transcriptional regulator